MKKLTTNTLIEQLVDSIFGANAGIREEYLLRQSLLNLVRLAKAEYQLEIKRAAIKAAGAAAASSSRRTARSLLKRVSQPIRQEEIKFE